MEHDNISWSAHFASLQNATHPPAITGLLPLFRDNAHSRSLPWRETALFVGKVIWKNNTPKARKPSSVTDSDVGDTEVMVMRFVELLKDEGVLKTVRSALYP